MAEPCFIKKDSDPPACGARIAVKIPITPEVVPDSADIRFELT